MNDDTKAASLAAKEAECAALRQRVEELSEQIHRLKPMADLNDMWKQELDDIGTIVGCDHHEGLARCVRQTLDKSEADLAAAQADSRRLDWLIKFIGAKETGLRLERVLEQDWSKNDALANIRAGIDEAMIKAALSATVAAGRRT